MRYLVFLYSVEEATKCPSDSRIISAFQIREETLRKSNLNDKCLKNKKNCIKTFRFFYLFFKKPKFWREVFSEKDYRKRGIIWLR